MPRQRILWTQSGEYARSILRQYNGADYIGHRFHGPHYVVYEQGEFTLRPYGFAARWRYSFLCRPQFLPGEIEPLWTFMVQ
jgi:hypothetical protein